MGHRQGLRSLRVAVGRWLTLNQQEESQNSQALLLRMLTCHLRQKEAGNYAYGAGGGVG